MPIPFDQNTPSEETEAKLCAYLEGELNPEERADIEQYLKKNPQHRQLLRELSATRFDVQKLPKEKAPAEIAEAFQGHIERSMLLDGGDDIDPAVRMNRWPQMALLAAMVVLAAGLGVIVYIILPGPVQKYSVAPPVTVVTTPPVGSVAAPAAKPIDKSPTIVPNVQPVASVPAPELRSPVPTLAPAAPSAVAGNDDINKSDLQLQVPLGGAAAKDQPAQKIEESSKTVSTFRIRAMDQTVTDRLSQAGLAENDNGRVVVVVHTTDASAADKQLRTYFTSNSIPYQAMEESVAEEVQTGANGAVALNFATSQPTSAASATTQPTTQEATNITPAIGNRENGQSPVFVAKAMTRDEAAQLKSTLSDQQIGQTAEVFPPLEQEKKETLNDLARSPSTTQPAATMPTTSPTASSAHEIAPGDRLVVSVAQLAGPGMDKTNTVKVAENGTIILPMIDPVLAAGFSSSDLETAIAEKYREGNLIPDAKVTVTPLPTTQPAEAGKPATTQPERVDVVVVIENNKAASQPTTAPIQP